MRKHVLGFALLICTSASELSAQSQPAGTTRTNLQRADLSIPGREFVQARVDLAPGASFPRHKHPGEEIIYVIEGSIEYDVDGKPAVILNAGDVLFVPYGVIHAARNPGNTNAAELSTYIVEKDMPLVVFAK